MDSCVTVDSITWPVVVLVLGLCGFGTLCLFAIGGYFGRRPKR